MRGRNVSLNTGKVGEMFICLRNFKKKSSAASPVYSLPAWCTKREQECSHPFSTGFCSCTSLYEILNLSTITLVWFYLKIKGNYIPYFKFPESSVI